MSLEAWKEQESSYLLGTYDRFPLAADRGKGARVWDTQGKEYIDFSSGIGVNSVGYCHPKWVRAVERQSQKLAHISNLFYTRPMLDLAEKLCRRSGMEGVFFANSGAEANEGMIKLARKYSSDRYGEGRGVIVSLQNSFHGRTTATMTATGQDKMHHYFYPFPQGFRYVETGDMASLYDAAEGDVCALMIELIQGEGGVMPLDREYVQDLAVFCAERDWLLLVDEVQTGVGRTGSLFAYQQYGILPDAVSFAKGIAGGLPMGGFLVDGKCRNVMGAGTHGSTFGGNPVCCAAGNAVLDILDENMLEEVRQKGEYLRDQLREMNSPYLGEVRGMGLMVGVTVRDMTNKALCSMLLKNGLICLTAGKDTLRLLPPLTITYEELDRGLEILRDVLA